MQNNDAEENVPENDKWPIVHEQHKDQKQNKQIITAFCLTALLPYATSGAQDLPVSDWLVPGCCYDDHE